MRETEVFRWTQHAGSKTDLGRLPRFTGKSKVVARCRIGQYEWPITFSIVFSVLQPLHR